MWTSLCSVNKIGWTVLIAVFCDVLLVYKRTDYSGSPNWGAVLWLPYYGPGVRPSLNSTCSSWMTSLLFNPHSVTQPRSIGYSTSNKEPVNNSSGGSSEGKEQLKARPLRWLYLPLSLGAAYVLVKNLSGGRENNQHTWDWEYEDLKTSIYKLLPLRLASKCWGVINDVNLPRPLRRPVINAFAWYTGCDISEAEVDDLQQYPNLSEFFRRTLKPGLRPICDGDCVVSPSDGKILHFGEVNEGFVEQVKGICYPLQTFLGPHPWSIEGKDSYTTEHEYHQKMLKHKDGSTALYHCVVYLAPGDYHRFHSPADWTVLRRRHFPGKLLSVKPRVASWVKGLFNINERVVYSGEWKHGFFSMTAVGATNVGSIKCYFDDTLATNKLLYKKNTWCDTSFEKGVPLYRGAEFGEFNMGSTIVLIFEAPKNFSWGLNEGQKIKYGEMITTNIPQECQGL